MSRYSLDFWNAELGHRDGFACERPAVADRIGRTGIGICKPCALRRCPRCSRRHLPGR